MATVVQQASEAVVIMDVNNKIQYVNPAFEKITGYSQEDVIGQTPKMWKHENYDPVLYEKNVGNRLWWADFGKGYLQIKEKTGHYTWKMPLCLPCGMLQDK